MRLLDAAVREARDAGRLRRERLRVVDLGCGNAYLTFAAYRHLTTAIGLSVELVGVDVKDQARRHNAEVATRLGWSDDVRFVEGTIATPKSTSAGSHRPGAPCLRHRDRRGPGAGRRVAERAGPCRSLLPPRRPASAAQARAPDPYGLVTRHGLLRERWGDVITDALRAHLLRRSGYRRTSWSSSTASTHRATCCCARIGPECPDHRAGGRVPADWCRTGGCARASRCCWNAPPRPALTESGIISRGNELC